MSRRNKITMRMKTPDGYVAKCWQNVKTGAILPTNWKLQAGYLAGPVPVTKRMQNRRNRRAEERRAGLAAFMQREHERALVVA